MPDALNNEPAPVGWDLAAGRDASHAALSAGTSGRRISASSFKLLTAKLKGAKTASAGTASRHTPDLTEIQPALVPAAIGSVPAECSQDVLEFSDSEPDEDLAVAAPPGTFAELPAFRPLTSFELPQTEEWAAEAGDDVPVGEDVPVGISAAGSVDTEQLIQPDFQLPEFRPVEWQSPPSDLESQPEPDALQPPDTFESSASAEEPSLELAAPSLPHPVPEHPAVADPGQDDIEAESETTFDSVLDSEIESLAEPEVSFEADVPDDGEANSSAAEQSPSGFIEDDARLSDLMPSLELLEPAEAAGHAEAIEPAFVQEAAPLLFEVTQSASQTDSASDAGKQPEPVAAGKVKAATSEMAGRVVDAMIKTISTAIYAKPTPDERASFLSDVAILMQDAAVETAAVAQAETEPVTRTASPAARSAPSVYAPAAALAGSGAPVTETIAERIGPAQLLKASTAEAEPDPFAQSALPARHTVAAPPETVNADEASGDLALTLLDMMSGGTGSLPHERTLAADTLLRILPRIPVRQLLSVVERVAIMETPPALLVAKLIRDARAEVVGPLLERCSHISDQDLMNAAPDGDTSKLRMVARRRILSTVLSDFLISTGEPGVLLTLIRNPGAALSHEAFFRLAEVATKHHGLLAPLATRADLPPPVAFELFWHVPQELRRFIFSRFLTDSETLNKILRITLTTHGNDGGDAMGDGKFPSRDAMDAAIGLTANNKQEEAAAAFGDIGGIAHETALRILSDREGEPVTVLFKALGCTRARFEEAIARLRLGEAGVLRPDRNPEELQAIFDGLSFNKARILLTYWDWYIRKAGPYAPHN